MKKELLRTSALVAVALVLTACPSGTATPSQTTGGLASPTASVDATAARQAQPSPTSTGVAAALSPAAIASPTAATRSGDVSASPSAAASPTSAASSAPPTAAATASAAPATPAPATPPPSTPAPTPGPVAAVESGSGVTVTLTNPTLLQPATVLFGNVSTPGSVELRTITSAPPPPSGMAFVSNGAFFDITSTASFDSATVCFDHVAVTAKSRLMHYAAGKWDDSTTSVAPPRICGSVNSLSPFFLGDLSITPAFCADATLKAQYPIIAKECATLPSPTPSPLARPVVPTTGLAIHGRVLAADGTPIGGACITLGPPIRCFTFTSRQADPANTGYWMINLTELAAPSGSTWDFYVIVRNYTTYQYPNYYSGTFTVSGIVEKNVKFQ